MRWAGADWSRDEGAKNKRCCIGRWKRRRRRNLSEGRAKCVNIRGHFAVSDGLHTDLGSAWTRDGTTVVNEI